MNPAVFVEKIRADFGLTAFGAAEIEFYLHDSVGKDLAPFWQELNTRCQAAGVALYHAAKERGPGQYEIALGINHPAFTARDVVLLKSIVCELAAEHGVRADFSAKPLADHPGNGLHIHVHLAGADGVNTFYKDDETISDNLKFSIGGLLAWLPDCMPVFAPRPESYARFVPGGQAPRNVSWGANNRTVAIRLPESVHANKRIEHRVAGADADPAKVVSVILAAMHDGLKRKIEPPAQMYGDASLPTCDLPKLPATLEEARARMSASKLFEGYFTAADLA